jgi:L-lactate dehydrogenase complex protein LldF
MDVTSPAFKRQAREALSDAQLQRALGNVRKGFIDKRVKAAERLPEFERLRDSAKMIKDHALANLDLYLEAYEARVTEAGGHVHWAVDGQEACEIILRICQEAGARRVTKGKTMIAEEIALNPYLEENGLEIVETDLGEYIVQLRDEAPSHIIAPAIHVNKDQVEDALEVIRPVLAEIGGERLVGPATTMTPGTFWSILVDGS